jgi:hypothetical protein
MTLDFLRALYDGRVDRKNALAITPHLNGKPRKTSYFHSITDAVEFAAAEAWRSDIWYRVGLVGDVEWGFQSVIAVTSKLRGVADRTVYVPAIYAELDKGKAFETIQERDRLLEAVQPSLVVQSSARGNVHIYALIRGGYVTRSVAARRCVRELNQRFRLEVETKGEKLFGRPVRLDPVHDLARVLRLPGTVNRKRTPAEPVTLLRYEQREHSIEELERSLPPLSESASRVRQASNGGGAPSRDATDNITTVPSGRRNSTLYRVAENLLFHGDDPKHVLDFIRELNRRRCQPPLDDQEVKALVMSAIKYRMRKLEERESA